MISVVIPALNEERIIEVALGRLLAMEGDFEVVVVDNGSTDATARLAARWARTISSPPGRGPAMNAGAAATSGDILLFLHADTALPEGAFGTIEESLAGGRAVGGCFSVAFNGRGWRSRLVEAMYAAFGRAGFFYGDAAIFVRRATFECLGGFKPLALMEDFDLCLRLRRAGATVRLLRPVLSSSRRWERQGFLKTVLVFLAIQSLYLLGFRHPRLFRLYDALR